jgi:hypothetical protein
MYIPVTDQNCKIMTAVQAGLGKKWRLYLQKQQQNLQKTKAETKQNKKHSKEGWRCGSSGRPPAYHHKALSSNPSSA